MQSKTMSLLESIINVLVGFFVAVAGQIIVFPLFDIHINMGDNLTIGLIFTVISIARSYFLRRLFNRIIYRAGGTPS